MNDAVDAERAAEGRVIALATEAARGGMRGACAVCSWSVDMDGRPWARCGVVCVDGCAAGTPKGLRSARAKLDPTGLGPVLLAADDSDAAAGRGCEPNCCSCLCISDSTAHDAAGGEGSAEELRAEAAGPVGGCAGAAVGTAVGAGAGVRGVGDGVGAGVGLSAAGAVCGCVAAMSADTACGAGEELRPSSAF